MRKHIIAFAVLAAGTGSAVAETWNVTKGEGADALKGEWSVTLGSGGSVTGVGFLGGPGREPVRLTIGGSVAGGVFTLKTTVDPAPRANGDYARRRTGDGARKGDEYAHAQAHTCLFVGRDQSPAFGGSATCGDAKSRWHVVRMR